MQFLVILICKKSIPLLLFPVALLGYTSLYAQRTHLLKTRGIITGTMSPIHFCGNFCNLGCVGSNQVSSRVATAPQILSFTSAICSSLFLWCAIDAAVGATLLVTCLPGFWYSSKNQSHGYWLLLLIRAIWPSIINALLVGIDNLGSGFLSDISLFHSSIG